MCLIRLRNEKPHCERGEEGNAAQLQAGRGTSRCASLPCVLSEVKMGSPARGAASGGGVLGNGHFADFSLALLSCLMQDLLPRSCCGSLLL